MHEALRALAFERNLTINPHLKMPLKADFGNISRIVTPSGDIKYEAGRTDAGHSDMTSSILLAIRAAHDFKAQLSRPMGMMPTSVF